MIYVVAKKKTGSPDTICCIVNAPSEKEVYEMTGANPETDKIASFTTFDITTIAQTQEGYISSIM